MWKSWLKSVLNWIWNPSVSQMGARVVHVERIRRDCGMRHSPLPDPEGESPPFEESEEDIRQALVGTKFEQLVAHLSKTGLMFGVDESHQSLMFHFRTERADYRISCCIENQAELFQIFGYLPLFAPPGARPMMCETIARANHGMMLGKFELDMDNGQIRFHAAILAADPLDVTGVDRLVSLALATLDRYLPAFMAVIYGNEAPEDAIFFAEEDIRAKYAKEKPAPESDSGDEAASDAAS